MHESGLAQTVAAALRAQPEPPTRVRVHIGDLSSSAEELADRIRTHLAAADPPVEVPTLEVVPRARHRLCASCATGWSSPDLDPPCPACAGTPLPLPHDHQTEIEFE